MQCHADLISASLDRQRTARGMPGGRTSRQRLQVAARHQKDETVATCMAKESGASGVCFAPVCGIVRASQAK